MYQSTLYAEALGADVTSYGNNHQLQSGDVLFTDAAGGDYHLVSGSPAIDLVASPADPPATDLDGNVRPAGTNYDAGVYEFGAVPPSPAELPYSDSADAAFAELGEDDLTVNFEEF